MFISHAQERALKRYNKELDDYAIGQIINSIKNKEYLYIGDSAENNKKHFVYVKYDNIPYKVLYIGEIDPKLITIYPIDIDEYNNLVEQKTIEKYIKYLEKRGYIVTKKEEG